ncbi:hypothetical protein BC938DRAFT_474757 [Jimgerdemannia flammicorona]|uniref:Uncharacterized protein n=1 Tax=Jimgerdemannia flammicorona TaxID=994334 RepID=A0A433QSC3_9FUNG|nr:hypothetical protein BC938DRAFT_474757 [Jimgerdemannia flammicorona]
MATLASICGETMTIKVSPSSEPPVVADTNLHSRPCKLVQVSVLVSNHVWLQLSADDKTRIYTGDMRTHEDIPKIYFSAIGISERSLPTASLVQHRAPQAPCQ